jgi:antitoxin component of MazEF toxin-antitoxin module
MPKVITIGNSSGILIPKSQLAALGLKVGDTVEVSAAPGKPNSLRVTPAESAELADWTKSFLENYRPALEALAKK